MEAEVIRELFELINITSLHLKVLYVKQVYFDE